MTLSPLFGAGPAIQFHVAFAAAALITGAAVAVLPKGTPAHRLLGRIGAGALLATALGSFFIMRHGAWSVIHLLSMITLVSLAGGILAARRRRFRTHRRFMTGAWIGLGGAALFTLLPGRVMHAVFFG